MNGNLSMDESALREMASFGMGEMIMSSPAAANAQHSFGQPMPGAFSGYGDDGSGLMDNSDGGVDANGKNRNRGNYRCSKCGEPKKGHVCPLVPTNFKCARCGLTKKACTCQAPTTRTIAIQVEMDEDMTTRALDLSQQGIIEFQTAGGYASPSSSAYASPVTYSSSPPRNFM